ncbi:MAG: 5-oxoprolinase subunit PxpB, partial [Chloroflexia bacterium]
MPKHFISPMGESAVLISWGNRVSMSLNAAIRRLTAYLRESLLLGVRDLVPAYASLLIVFEPQIVTEGTVVAWLEESLSEMRGTAETGSTGALGRHHVIPVQYGGELGPDLEELAAIEGVRAKDIIKAHTQRPFQVAFLGFLPGFAYMGKLPRRKPVPRLATPRTHVPTGSVGLAGFQTGIYPFSSPGGWQIIGRTGTSTWNGNYKTPALFSPGDTVRFVESLYEPAPPEFPSFPAIPARPACRVVQAGGLSMIQDAGRVGS